MKKAPNKSIAARVSLHEMSKARDGLILAGVAPEKLTSNSSILRAAILICCMKTKDPQSPASSESIALIKQLWKVTNQNKTIALETLTEE